MFNCVHVWNAHGGQRWRMPLEQPHDSQLRQKEAMLSTLGCQVNTPTKKKSQAILQLALWTCSRYPIDRGDSSLLRVVPSLGRWVSLGYIRKATSFMVLASVFVGVPALISFNDGSQPWSERVWSWFWSECLITAAEMHTRREISAAPEESWGKQCSSKSKHQRPDRCFLSSWWLSLERNREKNPGNKEERGGGAEERRPS